MKVLSPEHEKFCELVAAGTAPALALKIALDVETHSKFLALRAMMLMDSPGIAFRVAEIKARKRSALQRFADFFSRGGVALD